MRSLLLICLGCAACGGEPSHGAALAPLPRPAGIEVPAGADLQAAIDAAAPGATLVLAPGEYRGPVRIAKPLHLFGPPEACIVGGEGSTVRVQTDAASLRGFTVRGSGQRFDLMDGGVWLQGKDLVAERLTVRDSLFGILVEGCERAAVRGCTVVGTGLPAMGLRGDGIRLWETNDSEVVDCSVVGSRDLVVWYSSRNRLRANRVHGSRYGTHFMYSHDNTLADSHYVDCEVGVFVMYSRGITLQRNLLARAGGAAGIGLGLKEAGDVVVEDNWFLANTTGIYADASPLDPTHHNRYLRNVVRGHETAVKLHSAVKRTVFADNDFRDNGVVVAVGGQGDALGCEFVGNHYDTYRGYDLDGDGRGDVAFEFRRLSTQLEGRFPELALLHGAPAMGLVDMVGEVLPLFAPKVLLRDAAPRMAPLPTSWTPKADHGPRHP